MGRSPRDALSSLKSASLDQLMSAYPAEWRQVGAHLVEASKAGPTALERFVSGLQGEAAPWQARLQDSHGNPQVVRAALPALARARMGQLAVERMLQSAATGVTHGTVRLGLWSGLLVQRLFFRAGLERKPVSLTAFRFLWPLVVDRRKVMPLVQQRGIYCFFSRQLIRALARRLEGLECLEVAAGDGTLSRFLSDAGVSVRATDDHSWARVVDYPQAVEPLDAAAALQAHPVPVVLCSFPPPGNAFEKRIFAAPHVRQYLVITTRHRFAAGDWDAYEGASGWTMTPDDALSRLVLPPELDPVVLAFERR
jgi:hypothetical protein